MSAYSNFAEAQNGENERETSVGTVAQLYYEGIIWCTSYIFHVSMKVVSKGNEQAHIVIGILRIGLDLRGKMVMN
jgi:hypothetical protein